MSGGAPGAAAAGGAAHAVALYDSADELRRRVLPFLREGLSAGQEVVALVSERAAGFLRDGLGREGDGVRWQLPGFSYRSLGAVNDGLRRYLAERREAGQQVRLLAENDTYSSAARAVAYLRFEAASNDVLGGFGFPWTCLYDRRRYSPEVLDQVAQVHPLLLDAQGRVSGSAAYLPPDAFLAAHPGPLSAVPSDVALDSGLTAIGDLTAARHAAVGAARRLGLPAGELDDFELAAAEIMSNAVRHGEPPCRVRLWATAEHVVLRVDDQGNGDHVATKGFRPPDPAQGHLGGMGMWIARQLADALHVGTGPAGTAVEVQFPLAEPPGTSIPAQR